MCRDGTTEPKGSLGNNRPELKDGVQHTTLAPHREDGGYPSRSSPPSTSYNPETGVLTPPPASDDPRDGSVSTAHDPSENPRGLAEGPTDLSCLRGPSGETRGVSSYLQHRGGVAETEQRRGGLRGSGAVKEGDPSVTGLGLRIALRTQRRVCVYGKVRGKGVVCIREDKHETVLMNFTVCVFVVRTGPWFYGQGLNTLNEGISAIPMVSGTGHWGSRRCPPRIGGVWTNPCQVHRVNRRTRVEFFGPRRGRVRTSGPTLSPGGESTN